MASSAQAATTVTVAPSDTPSTGNCYPFGLGGDDQSEGPWTPYAAFFYKNLPPFELAPNTAISFDLNAINDRDIELDIDLAATTVNGGDIPAGSFTRVVSNSQTPSTPRGNTVIGDFELSYVAKRRFSFAGGGLIIRFSHPSAGFLTDVTCTPTLVGGEPADSSGFFLQRSLQDPDGIPPWTHLNTDSIGSFRVTNTPRPKCAGKTSTIIGTARADVLRGTPGPDVIAGLGGADRILGRGGSDRICGAGGRDRLIGGPGGDLLKGGGGGDTLRGGPGRDKLRGGPGRDLAIQ